MSEECQCDCFECKVKRHDICRHLIKCTKRPWTNRPSDDEEFYGTWAAAYQQ